MKRASSGSCFSSPAVKEHMGPYGHIRGDACCWRRDSGCHHGLLGLFGHCQPPRPGQAEAKNGTLTWRLGLGRWPSCSTHLLGQLWQPPYYSYAPPRSDGPAAHKPWGANLRAQRSLYVFAVYSLTLRTGSVSEILGMGSLKPTRHDQNGLGCARTWNWILILIQLLPSPVNLDKSHLFFF